MIRGLRTRRDPRRHFRRAPAILLFTIVLIALVVADQRGWLLVRAHDDFRAYHGVVAAVTRVIDGDTFEIALPDALHGTIVTRVRLCGVDCPELGAFGEPDQPYAADAAALATATLHGAAITLELEAHQTRDSFGRLLAHALLADGERLSERLLQAGLARAEERWPHSRLVRHAQLEAAARRTKTGIWSTPQAS